MWPSIDHSLLSLSGRMSKRALKAAQERERRKLFPDGRIPIGQRPAPETEREHDLRWAAELRSLAERGMHPRSYRKEADRLEAKWNVETQGR